MPIILIHFPLRRYNFRILKLEWDPPCYLFLWFVLRMLVCSWCVFQVRLDTEHAPPPHAGTVYGVSKAFGSYGSGSTVNAPPPETPRPTSPTRAERGKARAEGPGKSTMEEDTGCAQPEAAIRFQNIFNRPKTPNAPPPQYKNSKKRKDEGGQSSGVSNTTKGKCLAPTASQNSTTEAEPNAKVYKKRQNEKERVNSQRGFQVAWAHEFPWLEYNPVSRLMFCKACVRHKSITNAFTSGTARLRKETCTQHMLLDAHKYASEDTIPQQRAFLRSIDNYIMRDKTGIINLFCMAYVLIKRN